MLYSCTTIKPSIASVSMKGLVTDQAGLSTLLGCEQGGFQFKCYCMGITS